MYEHLCLRAPGIVSENCYDYLGLLARTKIIGQVSSAGGVAYICFVYEVAWVGIREQDYGHC